MKILTVSEVAQRLKVSVRRVNYLISAKRLPATRFGRTWAVRDVDLKLVEERKPGRPPKNRTAYKGNKS